VPGATASDLTRFPHSPATLHDTCRGHRHHRHPPQVAELDLNPVIARPDGVVAVDARLRVTSHRLADPFLRQLPLGDIRPAADRCWP
jgi:ATP-grasp domain